MKRLLRLLRHYLRRVFERDTDTGHPQPPATSERDPHTGKPT